MRRGVLTFPSTFTHKRRPRSRLLTTPHYGTLIRRKPHPTFMTSTIRVIDIICASDTKGRTSPDVLEHPFSNHGLSNSINHAGSLDRAASRLVSMGSGCRVCGIIRRLLSMSALASITAVHIALSHKRQRVLIRRHWWQLRTFRPFSRRRERRR